MTGLTDLDVQDDPFPYYRQRLDSCPVWHEEDLDLYVVGGLPEARAVLTDPVTFSNRPAARPQTTSEAALAFHAVLRREGLAAHRLPAAARPTRAHPPPHDAQPRVLGRPRA